LLNSISSCFRDIAP